MKKISYSIVKKIVLVALLGGLCFMFGNLYLKDTIIRLFPFLGPQQSQQQSDMAPPAPVMQEIQTLKSQIAQNPKDGAAYSQLGDLYFEAAMYDKALDLYKKAVDLNGKDLNSRNNLAICYHLLGKNKETFAQLDAALKMNPEAQDLWLTYGVISYENKDLKKAKEALEKAYKINPSSDIGKKAKSMLEKLNAS